MEIGIPSPASPGSSISVSQNGCSSRYTRGASMQSTANGYITKKLSRVCYSPGQCKSAYTKAREKRIASPRAGKTGDDEENHPIIIILTLLRRNIHRTVLSWNIECVQL
jgi:hypothetical protein